MKTLASVLSFALLLGAAPPPSPEASTAPAEVPYVEVSTLTVTAPRLRADTEVRVLKAARAGGAGVGLFGAGWMALVVVEGLSGPFGWAASLIFVGGMTSYLSHRRLQGHDDFPPLPAPDAGVAPSTGPASGAAR